MANNTPTISKTDVVGSHQNKGDQIEGQDSKGFLNHPSGPVTQHFAPVTYYLPPPPIDIATLTAANAKFAQLPVDSIPRIAVLPTGSRMPFSTNPLFVGRETELKILAKTLKSGESVAVGQIAAATGLGGIGKTQLAVAFVHHYGQFFVGGVHWLNFADERAIPAEVIACGLRMPELRADFATVDSETQLRLVLNTWQNPLPRLLIFDNCEDPNLLANWRPTTGGSRVLLTSRRRYWDVTLGIAALALDTLTRSQSIELLHKFRQDLPTTEPTLKEIAAELGDLPLALHLAGSYLARYRHSINLSQYLAKLRQPGLLQHHSLQTGDLSPTGHIQDVARTFALSYELLTTEEPTDKMARTLLIHIACFSPGELIPLSFILETIESNTEAVALQTEDALQRLTDLGLVERVRENALLLHRLIAQFVQQKDSLAIPKAQITLESILLRNAIHINNSGLPRTLLPWQVHLRHMTDNALQRSDKQGADLATALGYHLSQVGAYMAAKPYIDCALAIYIEVLGKDHPATALSYNNLGRLLQDIGNYVLAKTYFLQALAIREAVLGKKHPDTALTYNDLGSLLLETGDLIEAKPFLEHSLTIKEAVLGQAHPDTARGYNNLGLLLKSTGDLVNAKLYYKRAMAIREATLGKEHPDTADSYNNLGILLYTTGNLSEARSYLERALAIYKTVLGEDHPATAHTCNNLSSLLQEIGDLEGAKRLTEHSLTIAKMTLGMKHPTTANSYNNLGTMHHATGDYATAKSYFESALAIYETVLDKEHPDIALVYNNLGALLQDIGNYAAAKSYFEQALFILESNLGSAHPFTQKVQKNLNRVSIQYIPLRFFRFLTRKPSSWKFWE